MAGNYSSCRDINRYCSGNSHGADKGFTRSNFRQSNQYYEYRLLDQQGSAGISFLIVSTLIFFILFISVDYFVLFANHQIAKHVMYYHLERIRVEGWLPQDEEQAIRDKYADAGLEVEDISCMNGLNSAKESAGGTVVYKDPENPDASKIELKITLKPEQRPLVSATLIGADAAADDFRIKVGGMVLSEKNTE